MTRALLYVLAALAVAACGGQAAWRPEPVVPGAAVASPTPEPTRDPSKDSLPLVAEVSAGASQRSFQGGDDHITLTLENRGRDIEDLVIQASGWLAEHSGLGMGSSRACRPDLDTGEIDCGAVYAGQSMAIILRSFPAHYGTFTYEMRILARFGDRLLPVTRPDGTPAAFAFTEVVEPLTNQVPGGSYTPPP